MKDSKRSDFRSSFVLADSGGYQNVTTDIDIDPISILRIQEKVADAALILDVPPYTGKSGPRQFGESDSFDESLKKTVKNVELMLSDRKNKNLEIYGVLQGENLNSMKKWNDQMESFEFDGWALAPKPSTKIEKIREHLDFAVEHGWKKVHILQVSGLRGMSFIYYYKKYFDRMTFDSNTFHFDAIQNRIYTFFRRERINFYNKIQKNKVKYSPCICPVCTNIINKNPEFFKKASKESQLILGLHNLYVLCHYDKFFENLSEDQELYYEWMKKFRLSTNKIESEVSLW
jgi:tRNA-guanine family transglycosylase